MSGHCPDKYGKQQTKPYPPPALVLAHMHLRRELRIGNKRWIANNSRLRLGMHVSDLSHVQQVVHERWKNKFVSHFSRV